MASAVQKADQSFADLSHSLTPFQLERIAHLADRTSMETKLTLLGELNHRRIEAEPGTYEKALSEALVARIARNFDAIPHEHRAEAVANLKLAGAVISAGELRDAHKLTRFDTDKEKLHRFRMIGYPDGIIAIAVTSSDRCRTDDGAFLLAHDAVKYLISKGDTVRAVEFIQSSVVARALAIKDPAAMGAALTETAISAHACKADPAELVAAVERACFGPQSNEFSALTGVAATRILKEKLPGVPLSEASSVAPQLENEYRDDPVKTLDTVNRTLELVRASDTVKKEVAKIGLEACEALHIYSGREAKISPGDRSMIPDHLAYREIGKLLLGAREVLDPDQIRSLSLRGLQLTREFRATLRGLPTDHDARESERHMEIFKRYGGVTV